MQVYTLSFYIPHDEGEMFLASEEISEELIDGSGLEIGRGMTYDEFVEQREKNYSLFQDEGLELTAYNLINTLGKEKPTYGNDWGYIDSDEYLDFLDDAVTDKEQSAEDAGFKAAQRDWARTADISSFTDDLKVVVEEHTP